MPQCAGRFPTDSVTVDGRAREIVGVGMEGLVGHHSESVSFLAVSRIASAVTAS